MQKTAKFQQVPLYQHDSTCCVYLGTFHSQTHRWVDLYFCDQGGIHPTLIGRFSSDGPDYASGIEPLFDFQFVAYALAVERGLVAREHSSFLRRNPGLDIQALAEAITLGVASVDLTPVDEGTRIGFQAAREWHDRIIHDPAVPVPPAG